LIENENDQIKSEFKPTHIKHQQEHYRCNMPWCNAWKDVHKHFDRANYEKMEAEENETIANQVR
jgi:hypothetical protein